MTRDLSHEEARRSERGKLPVERNRTDGARMKSKEGKKKNEMKRAGGRLLVEKRDISQRQ